MALSPTGEKTWSEHAQSLSLSSSHGPMTEILLKRCKIIKSSLKHIIPYSGLYRRKSKCPNICKIMKTLNLEAILMFQILKSCVRIHFFQVRLSLNSCLSIAKVRLASKFFRLQICSLTRHMTLTSPALSIHWPRGTFKSAVA